MTATVHDCKSVENLLANEDANFRTEHFQDHEHLAEFVSKLRNNGAKDIRVLLDGEDWDGEIFIKIPAKISAGLVVAVASEQPDECDFEGKNFIRLWWD